MKNVNLLERQAKYHSFPICDAFFFSSLVDHIILLVLFFFHFQCQINQLFFLIHIKSEKYSCKIDFVIYVDRICSSHI